MTISGGLSPQDAGTYRSAQSKHPLLNSFDSCDRCALAEREDMVTVPRSLKVEVGTPAVLSWVDLPASITEDEEAEFGCQAVGGYPPPRLEVTGLGNLRSGSQESAGGGAGSSHNKYFLKLKKKKP